MTQYRIIRKNSQFGWKYTIQYKFFNRFWFMTYYQAVDAYDISQAKDLLKDMKLFEERKKVGNGVV